MKQQTLLYEGKAKKVYATDDDHLVMMEFKDDLTAFNAQKKGTEKGKGELNCAISTKIFEYLAMNGINTHFVKTLSSSLMLCQKVEIIPLEVVIRNIATGSLVKRLDLDDGKVLPFSLVEFYYKNDALNDPLINDEHALLLGCVKSLDYLEELRERAREINHLLREFFDRGGLVLVDCKLEFGLTTDGKILLADEISPDSCRLWDQKTNEKFDKDRFRQDLGGVVVAYQEVLERIGSSFESQN